MPELSEEALRAVLRDFAEQLRAESALGVHQVLGEQSWAWCEGFAAGSLSAGTRLKALLDAESEF